MPKPVFIDPQISGISLQGGERKEHIPLDYIVGGGRNKCVGLSRSRRGCVT